MPCPHRAPDAPDRVKWAQVGVAFLSPTRTWIEVTDKLCDILGYRRRELLQTTWAELIHADDVESDAACFEKLAGGHADGYSLEERLIRKDGSAVQVNVSVHCVRDADAYADHFVALVEDVTDRKLGEDALRESEARLRQFADTVDDVCWIADWSDKRVLFASSAYERIWGRTLQSLYDNPEDWAKAIHPDDRERAWEAFRQLKEEATYDEEYRIVLPDGAMRWIRDRGFPVRDKSGQVYRVAGIARDITERKLAKQALQESEERHRVIAEAAQDAIVTADAKGNIRFWNRAAEKIFGYAAGEVIGRNMMDCIVPPQYHQAKQKGLATFIKTGQGGAIGRTLELTALRKDGSEFPIEISVSGYREHDGYVAIALIRDIAERKQGEQQRREYAARLKAQQDDLLRQNQEMEQLTRNLGLTNAELALLTRIDPLTQLLNRRAWRESAQYQHERLLRYGDGYSVLMIDVDHFKRFNDSQGHQAGDECLVRLGQCLWSACRSTDFVGRYGGEEFVVLAPETDLETATALAERIREAVWDLNIPHTASPVADRATVCVGVAASDGGPWEDTVKRADNALYGAKHAGRNRVSVDLPARAPSSESPLPSERPCAQGPGGGGPQAAAGDGRGVTELKEFAETLPHRVAAIEGALGERDCRMLATLAAQLKDAADGCGSQAFAELAAELEDAATTNRDFNQLTAQVQALIVLSRHGRTAPTVL